MVLLIDDSVFSLAVAVFFVWLLLLGVAVEIISEVVVVEKVLISPKFVVVLFVGLFRVFV